MMDTLFILKIGGKVIEDEHLLTLALRSFVAQPGLKILIHGGGKRASELSRQLGIPVQMVQGRRITDAATLEVAVMVYAGLANKSMVARLQALGCNALGLSGADANTVRAHQRPVGEVDYGFAGDVDRVAADTLQTLLNGGLIPVFCAITHNGQGQLLNTNADTMAMELATALAAHYAVHLHFCFEKPGVLLNPDDDASVISVLQPADYQYYKKYGAISDGMIPKLDNAFAALQRGVRTVRIGDVQAIAGEGGTLLRAAVESLQFGGSKAPED